MIKGLCVESGKGDAKFVFKGSTPKAGREYILEDGRTGSGRQNRLYHSLVKCFHDWMLERNTFIHEDNGIIYDLSTPSPKDLKDYLKYKYGLGFSHINYVNKDFEIDSISAIKPDDWDDSYGEYRALDHIPMYVLESFNKGNKKRVKGVLISWVDYNMTERYHLIKTTFLLMDIFGVDSDKYKEIREGLEALEKERKLEEKRLRDEKKRLKDEKRRSDIQK